MYCTNGSFVGAAVDGGFAHFLRTSDRACIRLAEGVEPRDVAAHADAGITAYRAAKRAAAELGPGSRCVVVGAGGLGHIAVQVLKTLCPANVTVVDTSDAALELASQLGADATVKADEHVVEAVQEATGGLGADAALDFVGEHETPQQVPAMLAQGGAYYVIGYGGQLTLPLTDIVLREIRVIGNLVGNSTELSELITLAAQGRIVLHTQPYGLDQINTAIDDLTAGRIRGRGIIVPAA
jgi:NAD+-dependent secondary alcohol dehydrogenase Adh1